MNWVAARAGHALLARNFTIHRNRPSSTWQPLLKRRDKEEEGNIEMTQKKAKTGSCLCGQVTYEISGPLRQVTACHCIQCRKTTGHFMAATNVAHADFKLTRETGLKWYRASDFAKRGFCQTCGATVFWQRDEADNISITAGTLDGKTGLKIDRHIFCEFAGDYYEIGE